MEEHEHDTYIIQVGIRLFKRILSGIDIVGQCNRVAVANASLSFARLTVCAHTMHRSICVIGIFRNTHATH